MWNIKYLSLFYLGALCQCYTNWNTTNNGKRIFNPIFKLVFLILQLIGFCNIKCSFVCFTGESKQRNILEGGNREVEIKKIATISSFH